MPPGTAPGQPVTLPQDVDVAATLPSTDPSLARFGGADEAHLVHVRPSTSTSTSPHLRNNYAPDHSAPTALHHEPFMTYHEFGAQQQAEPDQFTGFELHPGAPLTWDWANPNGYSDFSNHYEPQGELVQELQAQSTATENDFSLPLPANLPEDSSFHSPQQYSSAPKATVDPQTSMGTKRKAESEPNSAVSHPGSLPVPSDSHPAKRANKSRSSSSASATSPIVATATASEATTKPTFPPDQNDRVPQSELHTNNELPKRRETGKGTGPQGRVIDVSRPRRVVESPGGYDVLPAGKVFPIQIGSELFRLSGASLSSDAPSYFSHFFREQIHSNQGRAGDVKTLYIDRDPNTFRDIVSHLQGYYITPRDGEHFVRLFADAQFYSLPRLTKQLFSTDIFIRIGGVPFQIPRDLFSSPGDSPNYFTLGFAQFFSTPSEVFPGLDRNALLRPPSIHPPSVPNRSGEIFQELVKMLQGYTVEIRSDTHRAQLLRDARYFHLKGLEQKLIPCHISYNLKRSKSEILIRLDDVRQSGVSFIPDSTSMSSSGDGSRAPSHSGISEDHVSPQPSLGGPQLRSGTVSYARPYTDDHSSTNVLILEISASESTTLHLPKISPDVSGTPGPLAFHARATFRGSTLARITSLFSVIASKMGLPANQPLGLMMLQSGGGVAAQPVSPANSGLSERRVRVRIDVDCYIEINNLQVELAIDQISGRVGLQHTETVAKGDSRKWIWGGPRNSDAQGNDDDEEEEEEEEEEELVVTKAHWRLRVESVNGDPNKMQVVLCGARLEGYNEERDRNHSRKFLG